MEPVREALEDKILKVNNSTYSDFNHYLRVWTSLSPFPTLDQYRWQKSREKTENWHKPCPSYKKCHFKKFFKIVLGLFLRRLMSR